MPQQDTFPSYSVILLQFTETSSNLAAAQAAKTMLRPLSPVASPVAPFWIVTDITIPDENQSE